jgi:hypothetical protein
MQSVLQMSWDSLVSIETMLNDGRSSNWGSILGRARDFSFLHNNQTDSGTHPASYTQGTRDCFPGGKTAGA